MTKGYKKKAKVLLKKTPPFQGVKVEIVGLSYNFDNNKTIAEQIKNLLNCGKISEKKYILFTFKEYINKKLIIRSVKLSVKEAIK